MESHVENLPKSAVKLTITVSPAEMRGYFTQAAKALSKRANIQGFRKGKAPRSILEARVGKEYLAHQAMELAVSDSYYQAIVKHQLRPIGRPQTDLKHEHAHLEEQGLSFTATVPVMPDVQLGDYKAIRVKPQPSAYSDKLVDEALEQLQKSRAGSAQVTRAAKTGDRVEIDFVGKIGGQEFEGGKSENHPLVLGEGSFVPGFEDELVGLKAGQVKTFTVKFPKDYRATELAGKPAEFTVTMKQVQETTLPPLDDAFATGFGATSLAELRKRLAENLKTKKEAEATRATETAVVDAVVDRATVEVPEALAEEELTGMMAELRQQIERQGLPYDKYLEHLGKTEDDLRKEHRDQAERRVKMSLVLNAVQDAEGITPTDQQIKAEVDRQLAQVNDDADRQRIKDDEFRRYVGRVLGNRLAVERLVRFAGADSATEQSG